MGAEEKSDVQHPACRPLKCHSLSVFFCQEFDSVFASLLEL